MAEFADTLAVVASSPPHDIDDQRTAGRPESEVEERGPTCNTDERAPKVSDATRKYTDEGSAHQSTGPSAAPGRTPTHHDWQQGDDPTMASTTAFFHPIPENNNNDIYRERAMGWNPRATGEDEHQQQQEREQAACASYFRRLRDAAAREYENMTVAERRKCVGAHAMLDGSPGSISWRLSRQAQAPLHTGGEGHANRTYSRSYEAALLRRGDGSSSPNGRGGPQATLLPPYDWTPSKFAPFGHLPSPTTTPTKKDPAVPIATRLLHRVLATAAAQSADHAHAAAEVFSPSNQRDAPITASPPRREGGPPSPTMVIVRSPYGHRLVPAGGASPTSPGDRVASANNRLPAAPIPIPSYPLDAEEKNAILCVLDFAVSEMVYHLDSEFRKHMGWCRGDVRRLLSVLAHTFAAWQTLDYQSVAWNMIHNSFLESYKPRSWATSRVPRPVFFGRISVKYLKELHERLLTDMSRKSARFADPSSSR